MSNKDKHVVQVSNSTIVKVYGLRKVLHQPGNKMRSIVSSNEASFLIWLEVSNKF